MKQKLLSLLIVPTLLLCSCKGPKIEEDKARELANKISENQDKLQDYGSIITVEMKNGKEGLKYEINQGSDSNVKLKIKGSNEDEKLDFVLYSVKNEEHEEITYIKDYDQEKKSYNEYVYSKKLTENYSLLVFKYSVHALLPTFFVAAFADPVRVMENDEYKAGEYVNDGITYENKVNYYSSGEKNLTIEIHQKYVSGEPIKDETPADDEDEVEEYAKETKMSITYDNLVIKSIDGSTKSNLNNNSSFKANVELKKTLNIDLPAGWEKLLGNN